MKVNKLQYVTLWLIDGERYTSSVMYLYRTYIPFTISINVEIFSLNFKFYICFDVVTVIMIAFIFKCYCIMSIKFLCCFMWSEKVIVFESVKEQKLYGSFIRIKSCSEAVNHWQWPEIKCTSSFYGHCYEYGKTHNLLTAKPPAEHKLVYYILENQKQHFYLLFKK